MLFENIKARGFVTIELFDSEGNLKDRVDHENLIVTVGKGFITSRMKDATAGVMNSMAVGDGGATAPAVSQTQLSGELGRVALSSTSQVTTTVTNDTLQYQAVFNAGAGSGALTEAGIFNSNTPGAGTMLSRVVFAEINKGANDSVQITWKIQIT